MAGNASSPEFRHQRRRYRWPQRGCAAAVRKVDNRSVFGHYRVDEMQAAGDAAQFIEDPTGDEHHDDPSGARHGNGVAH